MYIIAAAQISTGLGKDNEPCVWLDHNKGNNMNFTKLFLSIMAVFALAFAVVFITYTLAPDAAVTAPEVKPAADYRMPVPGDYRRPVREGNCYRHFTPTGTVLACG
jgi:hypothetical protein